MLVFFEESFVLFLGPRALVSHSAVKVDFLSISYRQLEKQVADDVNVAMERVCGTLEQESSRLTQTMGETVFELYTSLKILKGFREFLPLKLVL